MNNRIKSITKRNYVHVLRTAANRPISIVLEALLFAVLEWEKRK